MRPVPPQLAALLNGASQGKAGAVKVNAEIRVDKMTRDILLVFLRWKMGSNLLNAKAALSMLAGKDRVPQSVRLPEPQSPRGQSLRNYPS